MIRTHREIANYWDARPCNINHGTAAVGSLEWSEQVTERKYFVESHIPRFAEFHRWKGRRVLEIGCGIGTDSLSFLEHGAQLSVIDISHKSIDLFIKRAYTEGLFDNLCHIYWDDAERWIPYGTFDLIYSFGVLHHAEHPEKVLRLAHDRLSDAGELRIMLYAKYSLKFLLGGQPEAQKDCPTVHTYSMRSARTLLRSCGFDVIGIQKTHIFPWRIEDYIAHRYVKKWPYRFMPQWFFMWLERYLGHHLLIVARKA